jgi:hypothetical protein
MIGFDGRLQWRQQELFKLRAKLPQCKKNMIRNELGVRRAIAARTLRTQNLRLAHFLCVAQEMSTPFWRASNSNSNLTSADPVFSFIREITADKSRISRSIKAANGMSIASLMPVDDDCGSAGMPKPSMA